MSVSLVQLAAVAAGGAAGAIARYLASLGAAAVWPGRVYLGTLLINVVGSLAMGALYVIIVEKSLLPDMYRPLLMVGLLGAFTTFSTFALEVMQLAVSGSWSTAAAYMVASVVFTVVAAAAGYYAAQWLVV